MPHNVRRHVRSNGVAYLALMVALSGSAYATATIGSADIKTDAVQSRHIENGQIRTEDVRNGSLTGSDVQYNSLTGRDIKESTLEGACPDRLGMTAVGQDLCYSTFDLGFPTQMDFPTALTTCSNLGLRLPTLAEAFQAAMAWPLEGFYWTADAWQDAGVNYAWAYQSPQSFEVSRWNETAAVRCVVNRTP